MRFHGEAGRLGEFRELNHGEERCYWNILPHCICDPIIPRRIRLGTAAALGRIVQPAVPGLPVIEPERGF